METETKQTGGWFETVKTIVSALLIAGVFRTLFFQPFWIPSGSMKDTLLIGDFLFVNKMAYGYAAVSCPFSICPIQGRIFGSMPERGDVVVFRHPTNGQDFIKRLIGLPGDRVQMIDGIVHVNGAPFPQTPAGEFIETYERQGPQGRIPQCRDRQTEPCVKERSIETLPNGVEHAVLNIGESLTDNTLVKVVPEGEFFFMGDNRDNSGDSRSEPPAGVGTVPFDHLIGRADRVMFSSAGRSMFFFWTWRSDRFFKAIE